MVHIYGNYNGCIYYTTYLLQVYITHEVEEIYGCLTF